MERQELVGKSDQAFDLAIFLAMKKSEMNPKVDSVHGKEKKWKKEFEQLRAIVLETGLTEELKWGQACYTLEGANIVLIHGFKEYFALLFMKGALLKDPKGILIQQTQNVQSARQIRFKSLQEVVKLKSAVKAYIKEAVEVEKAGLKVTLKKSSEFDIPEEFLIKLDEVPGLKAAFDGLTPGRQRGYLLFFSAAKQSKTREARIEKNLPRILAGKGLDD